MTATVNSQSLIHLFIDAVEEVTVRSPMSETDDDLFFSMKNSSESRAKSGDNIFRGFFMTMNRLNNVDSSDSLSTLSSSHSQSSFSSCHSEPNMAYLFIDAVQEASLPYSASNEDLASFKASSTRIPRNDSDMQITGKVFKAFDELNYIDSCDSLASLDSSSTLAEITVTSASVINAVESLSLGAYGSTNSLSSMDGEISHGITSPSLFRSMIPAGIKRFFGALEEFLQNQQPISHGDDNSFPKFC